MEPNRTIVISLGGSMIVPEEIDVNFVRTFSALIRSYVARGYRFAIITGGGKVCRKYQQSLAELRSTTNIDLDWMGIHVTRLNAQFVRMVLEDIAHPDIILDPTELVQTTAPVIIGAGWKPGWSTDYDAVSFATTINADSVINISNVEYVYTADPKTNPDAIKLTDVSWGEFRKLIPETWESGANVPFDPIASKLADEKNISVVFMSGKNLTNLEQYLQGQKFEGTVIHN